MLSIAGFLFLIVNMLGLSFQVFALQLFAQVSHGCVFVNGKYDLSILDWSPWLVVLPKNGTDVLFEISLCKPLNYNISPQKEKCANSSVCRITNGTATNMASYAFEPRVYNAFEHAQNNGFSLYLVSSTCNGKIGSTSSVVFSFVCGPDLGSPELLMEKECNAFFTWRTSAVCKKAPVRKEVPCYVYDKEGRKINLAPLIKQKGGYDVISPNVNIDFVINVCSDIYLGNDTHNCPKGSSACRNLNGQYVSFGTPDSRLQLVEEGLLLTYKTKENILPQDCDLPPKTTVLFRCPQRRNNMIPRLISDTNCQYEVEWETEYACPEDILKGDLKKCQFTKKEHGVEIDLSPLRKNNGVYHVVGDVNGTSTDFSFNVCGGLNASCGGKNWSSAAVCANYSKENSSQSEIVGTMRDSALKFADGSLMLSYGRGADCSNGLSQTTIINFLCNKSAENDGQGNPSYLETVDCVNYFKWETKYACLRHQLESVCSARKGKKIINLQNLMKSEGELPWVALDRRYIKDKDQNATYFINICGEVSHLESVNCEIGTSICMKDNNDYLSLGMFTSPPSYDSVTDHVKLEYTGGSLCHDQQAWKSVITFICKPGHMNTAPALVKINTNDCEYQFEWHTAEACPEGFIHGNECRITDSNLGLNFDLTPLKQKVYEINTDVYKFYLSVCEPVKNSSCGKDYASQNIGACQVERKSNPRIWKIGEASSEVSYSDGIVKLTYLHGDPYNNINKTLRMTVIIFICDIQAGKGDPHFVEEANYVYVFHWFTDLVCQHSVSTECVVTDPVTHQQYDLSRLSRSRQNWVVLDTEDEDEKEKKFYINVCRPLVSSTSCDPVAAACLVNDKDNKELQSGLNLGQALIAPQIVSEGHLQLNYTHGDPCSAYDQQVNYSTVIHFICSNSAADENEGPRFLDKVGECQYMFLWTTEAACPSNDIVVENECQLTDPDTGFIFDLTSLQKRDFYTVSAESYAFQVNICGAVKNGCQNIIKPPNLKNISVCDVNNQVGIATSDSYILRYTGEELSLIYRADTAVPKEKSVVITFPCDNTTVEMNPRFIKEDFNSYFFEMKTSLTCQLEQYDCTFTDAQGNEYDLNPLSRSSDINWEVVDVREKHSDLRYHINFCRPLNRISDYKCPGGAIAACQTSVNNHAGEGSSLGTLTGTPEVSEDGLVTIHYAGGSFCHNGQFKRSTRINLFCSSHQGELVFIGETPECEYIFYFDTPAACPLHTSHGTNCMVTDPAFGYIFDLKPLQRMENYIVQAGEYEYVLNACGPLNGFSNLCKNSGVCQIKPADKSFAKSLGQPSADLVYRRGILELKYTSGSGNCHKNYTRSTIISFTCDHSSAENKKGPSFVSEEEDCTYLFEWPTSYACPPFTVTECVAEDNEGQQYDLSGLSLTNENYFVKNPNVKNQTFIINVCRSVVHTPDSLCPYKAAACLVDSSRKRQENLGEVTGRPYFENNKLKIKYTLGDKCMYNGRNSGQFMETVIMFECDKQKIDSKPEFIGQDSCTYHFIWYTSFACPLKALEITSDCNAENPLTGFKYDLSILKKDTSYVIQKGNHKFSLNVCGNLKDSSCGPESGACQQEMTSPERHWNAGNSNSELHFHDGILFLNYSGGDYCHQKRFQRNTIITFHCGKDLGEPTFLYESDDCTYYFNWDTELACETLVHCAINNGSYHYDLLPLASVSGYHTAVSNLPDDNATYYISVCHPLNPTPSSCPPGSSICLVSNDGIEPQNLGRVEYPPFVDFEGHATAIYTNGSICPSHPEEKNKARIIFICEPGALLGEPVLIAKVEDICYYIFEWRTSIVCPEEITPPPQPECSFVDSRVGIFDLAPLQKIGSNYEIKDNKEGLILLNVCGTVNSTNLGCSKASVCFNDSTAVKNFGTSASQKFSYDGVRLRLTFSDGDDCLSSDTGKSTSEILFTCNLNSGIGKPTLFKKYPCLAVFLWETNLVCENVKHQCNFDIGGKYFDFHLLSSLSHNWNVTDGKGNTYWLNMCQGLQPSRDTIGCSSSAAVCRKDSNGHFASLGMIHTMEAKQTDSGELMLKYTSGSSEPCSEAGSSKGIRASTTIHFTCGSSRGEPELLFGPNGSCYFDFKWETSLACPEKMEEVMLEENGIVYDKRLDYGMNLTEILNGTFTVHGHSGSDEYIYIINLGQGTKNYTNDDACSLAAVCQTKSITTFHRDIGSYDSRKFYIRGSELHLVLTSRGRPCGKNKNKNVTTVINMQCSSFAGVGSPEFLYETGNCDYIFHWETKAVCPDFNRLNTRSKNSKHTSSDVQKEYHKSSSHTTELVLGFILSAVTVCIIIFIISKEERRAVVSSKFRNIFNRVRLPQFRYKRDEGETLILIGGSQACNQYDDGNDVDILT